MSRSYRRSPVNKDRTIAIRLKIQTKSSHKIHKSELLRLDFVNLNSWIAIIRKKAFQAEDYNSYEDAYRSWLKTYKRK